MKYNKQIVGILVLMALIAPQFTFAEAGAKGNKFCENVSSSVLKSEQKFLEKENERNSKMANRQAELGAKRTAKDDK